MSGIGKGITTASTARIFKDYGFRVTAVKIDPYLNIDAGTMNPTEHGEVFVTDDGMECDQDVGNYERFLGEDIPKVNYMTAGLVYQSVIEKERNLAYGGKCVEVIPHITDEVERRLMKAAQLAKADSTGSRQADFVLVEIGGTVGEYQNLIFLETARIMKLKMPDRVLFMLVSYFPIPKMIGEMKTKPTQHAVRALNSAGIQPDIIIARSAVPLDESRKLKVSVFCNMQPQDIISAPDIASIYEVPVNFEEDNLGRRILAKFGLKTKAKGLKQWKDLVDRIRKSQKPARIGIVGKYFGTGDFILSDSYLSVIEAVKQAAFSLNRKAEVAWLDAESYERDAKSAGELKKFDGIIVPGGFGARGVEGKIKAIEYVRKNNIPFLGLCYGLQLATVEFARNVCGLRDANTTEVDPQTPHPIIHTMAEQVEKIKQKDMGGSMRLGAYDCQLNPRSISHKLYAISRISERHRHRYEVNEKYVPLLEKKGLLIAGRNPQRNLVEVIELPKNKFFIASQFHPEFKARPLSPHPLFVGFIKAATE